jgi:hypothetical protein
MKEPKALTQDEAMQGRSQSARTKPVLNRDIQAKIGQQLRAVYDGIVQQGVPDRFVDLLQRVEQADAEQEGRGEVASPVVDGIKRDAPA